METDHVSIYKYDNGTYGVRAYKSTWSDGWITTGDGEDELTDKEATELAHKLMSKHNISSLHDYRKE